MAADGLGGDTMMSALRAMAVTCAARLGGAMLSGCGTTGAENASLMDKALPRSHARLQIHREGIVGAAVPAPIVGAAREGGTPRGRAARVAGRAPPLRPR